MSLNDFSAIDFNISTTFKHFLSFKTIYIKLNLFFITEFFLMLNF